MFSLDAFNRKLCIFHYELWRTFVVKVSLTHFHNFFWNFDTFKAWGGGVGKSVLNVYMYIYGGRTGGDFFLCGACWTDVSWIKFPRNALRFCSFSLVMFWIFVFPWIFNFKFAQYCFQYCHLRWHGVNASVLGYFIQKALTLKYFVFQMLHSM